MSDLQIMEQQDVSPPLSFREPPLTPPSTNKKPAAEAQHRVIALFNRIQAGRYTEGNNWIEYWLATGEFDQIQSNLQQDDALLKYAEASIRYDYDETKRRLVVRMPTGVHEFFVDKVEDNIRTQLKVISKGPGRTAQFAKNLRPARSTEIRFTGSKSRYHPDISFGRKGAKFPGVIFEIAYSQLRLDRLAESYIVDSNANIRVVVGLDIAYGKESRKATLSVWRPQISNKTLVVVAEATDEVIRNDKGNSVGHPGLRLRLSDFTCQKIALEQIGDEDIDICISGEQLCEYIAEAEDEVQQATYEEPLPDGINKRKRSETPPEEIRSDDEVKYAEQERRAAKRADHDMDYEDRQSAKSLSE
ncbi:uncharacterized protein BDR25DRAFT_333100 [Lindgomyces ingoldianus]|uniref:Uncharacterized protein n=1 Tax=Lindgomyces ingoldianus TaxID=673940 RepID=A0ACB6R0W5_9PLEO|nr:uncharacterized protein BDR25DRAFT_333100 [Lindgomyces ingoldianus]KAF2472781.1 hypothetical protein BDR25DRAFT_333100 [Lindgomyces ingoldianus]